MKDAPTEEINPKSETAPKTKVSIQHAASVAPTISQAFVHTFAFVALAPTTPGPTNKRGAKEISTSRSWLRRGPPFGHVAP